MITFVFFKFTDILPMFADIFADKSDNFFLDPWRYIRQHDICNTVSITMHGQYFLQRFLLLSSKLEITMALLGQEWSKRARMGAMEE